MNECPIWYHDPNDEERYDVAVDNKCPADGAALYLCSDSSSACMRCCRVFDKDGRRLQRVWWSGFPQVRHDELGAMVMALLRSARPHPVEHPTMWQVWGDVCERVGLNPDDYRIPTSRDG